MPTLKLKNAFSPQRQEITINSSEAWQLSVSGVNSSAQEKMGTSVKACLSNALIRYASKTWQVLRYLFFLPGLSPGK